MTGLFIWTKGSEGRGALPSGTPGTPASTP